MASPETSRPAKGRRQPNDSVQRTADLRLVGLHRGGGDNYPVESKVNEPTSVSAAVAAIRAEYNKRSDTIAHLQQQLADWKQLAEDAVAEMESLAAAVDSPLAEQISERYRKLKEKQ